MTYLPGTGVTGPQKTRIDRFLDTNGDGTGVDKAVGNYAGGATSFFIQPPAGVVYRLARMMVYIEDSGTFDSGSYGNGVILTNGIKIQVTNNAVVHSMDDGKPVITNVHWGRLSYDLSRSNFGAGNEAAAIRWSFDKAGQFVRLVGDDGDKFEAILHDDFTGLVDHTFLVQGYVE